MKFLPNLFHKSQLTKIFLCFPDPHFKARKHKARIISPTLVAEYAYVLREGGRIYVVTDVQDLYEWFRMSFESEAGRDLFFEVKLTTTTRKRNRDENDEGGGGGVLHDENDVDEPEILIIEDLLNPNPDPHSQSQSETETTSPAQVPDPCIPTMQTSTEEGKKVSRNHGDKFVAVWQRKADPAWPSAF